MANKPFDYTIINPLERPTSSDLNQLQGQAHADARQLFRRLFIGGFQYGFFPNDFKVVPTSPASMSVVVNTGIGFLQEQPAEMNIGGIAGLNDEYHYKVAYLYNALTVATAAVPTSGNFRYDLIQVRARRDDERLTDETPTSIYNPALNSFGGADRYKTLTLDLSGYPVEYLPAATPATQPVSYKIGVETPIGLFAPAPTVDPGYLAVAYIRVLDTSTSIVAADITDARPILQLPDALVPGNISDFGSPGSVVYSNGSNLLVTSQGVSGQTLQSAGSGTPVWSSNIAANRGGTGFTSYSPGDMLYANSSVSLAKLAAGTASQVLRGGTTPSWGTIPSGAFATNTVPVSAIQSTVLTQSGVAGTHTGTTSWTDILTLSIAVSSRLAMIGVRPKTLTAPPSAAEDSLLFEIYNNSVAAPTTVKLAYRVSIDGTDRYYGFTFNCPASTATPNYAGIALPPVPHFFSASGTATIALSVQLSDALDELVYNNFSLYLQQG